MVFFVCFLYNVIYTANIVETIKPNKFSCFIVLLQKYGLVLCFNGKYLELLFRVLSGRSVSPRMHPRSF